MSTSNDDQLLITYDDDYVAGQALGDKYELLRPIAEGGMGVVWLAHDRTLDVDVAVKISRRFLDDSSQLMARRALSEARLAAQLAHPAICRVLDFGLSSHGDPFVVSELMHGEELDHVLHRERRMTATLAVRTVLPILDGLSAAHSKGIIHRDVKPANMFLARDAEGRVQPKLLDFGVARVVNNRLRITEPGMVCGTAYYMSPEQARGSVELDARSDLWSFCASLYELVSGSPPFDGANYNQVLSAVLTSDPKPLGELLVVDAALSAIIMRGLARNPSQRFSSAQELGRELSQWLLDQDEEHDICGHSLRERLTAYPDLPVPNSVGTLASSYRARLATPRALSTTVAAAEARPRANAGRILRIGAASAMLGGVLGAAALVFHSIPESRAARAFSPNPPALAAAASELAPSVTRSKVATAVVPISGHARLETPGPPDVSSGAVRSERKPVRPIPTIASKAGPVSQPESRLEKQQPPISTTLPRKTNALGYDFGL